VSSMDDVTFSKSTGVKVTIGAIIGLVAFAVFVDRRFGALESTSVNQTTDLETMGRRQNTYIERRNSQHDNITDDINDISDRLDRLCEALASRESAIICND
jgi:hypothetical protein